MGANGIDLAGLSRAECLDLLGTVAVGRLALTIGALPVVLPVAFVANGDGILAKVGTGPELDAATDGTVVAFEADDFDPHTGEAWTVAVTGSATHHHPDEATRARLEACLHCRPGLGGDLVIRISPDLVTGRRHRVRPLAAPAVPGAGRAA